MDAADFKNKTITLMGLGVLGRGIGVAKFFAEQGALLTITDLKSEVELAESIQQLEVYPNIVYHLGSHQLADFRNPDIVIKAPGVPLDSEFIAEARAHKVSVEMDASLFVKLAPEITVIGVTGTRGKSTVAHLIYEILHKAGKRVFLGGNVRNTATLPLLHKVRAGDTVVLELDSWQLQGFGDAEISPNVSVFTNLMQDHQNYYPDMETYFKDKANIFAFQDSDGVLIAGSEVAEKIKAFAPTYQGTLIVPDAEKLPPDWTLLVPGIHNKHNVAYAIAAAEAVGVGKDHIQKGVESFAGVPGRLTFAREVRGVQIYNDNNATTPEATRAGLFALDPNQKKNIVLIMGGTDKGLDMSVLLEAIPLHCKAVVLLNESGTDLIKQAIYDTAGAAVFEGDTLPEVLRHALSVANKGDIVLFSPAFASFGKHFANEYDRHDQFMQLVSAL